MKNLIIITLFCLASISCETESFVINSAPDKNLVSNSTLVEKLLRMTQFPTTADNAIDNTSCFALNLPVTVVADNTTVIVNSEQDYQQVEDILAASNNDIDLVQIQFPVQVTYFDYT